MTAAGTKQIVVQTEKNLIGLAANDGQFLWQVACPPRRRAYNAATPIVDDSTVFYTGQGQGTRAVKIQKQDDGFAAVEVWNNPEVGAGYNTPVLKDGLLFGLSDRGNFYCLNAATGEAAWTDTAKRERFGSLVDAGSVILALPSDADMIALKPSNEQYTELARIKVADTQTYAHPVIAGSRIFVKDRETVALWTIE